MMGVFWGNMVSSGVLRVFFSSRWNEGRDLLLNISLEFWEFCGRVEKGLKVLKVIGIILEY